MDLDPELYNRACFQHRLLETMFPNQMLMAPSFSLFKGRRSTSDLERALSFYLKDNPVYSDVTLIEKRMSSPEEAKFEWMYELIDWEFNRYANNFRVIVHDFDSDPDLMGISMQAPFSKMDGRGLLRLHIALVESATTKTDVFRNAAHIEEYRLDFKKFQLPTLPTIAFSDTEAANFRPLRFAEMPSKDVIPANLIYDKAAEQARTCTANGVLLVSNLMVNSPLTFGNYLIYPRIAPLPSDGASIRTGAKTATVEYKAELLKTQTAHELDEHLHHTVKASAGSMLINNYGNFSPRAPADLVDYKWSLPRRLCALMANAILGMSLRHRSRLFMASGHRQPSFD